MVLDPVNSHLRVAFLPGARISIKGPKNQVHTCEPTSAGGHLKKCRLQRRLRQVDAALLLNVSVDTYRLWERDRVEPEATSWKRILAFLGYDPSPAGTALGGRLRRWRRALGLTQVEAAYDLGVSPDSYQGWEADSYPPSPAMRAMLLRRVG
jgi:DNA-binding XRE family transcriptional regulator